MPFKKIKPFAVKLLKSPDSTHMVWAILVVATLGAIGEVLCPCTVDIETIIAGTPIEVISKTANCYFIYIKLV